MSALGGNLLNSTYCLYNIHGFTISVEGIANKAFLKEYGWAKVTDSSAINLYVKPYKGQESLPTKPAGSLKGMYVEFEDNEDILWYEEGVPLNVLLAYCEALLYWPNKVLLHAGAVAKEGRALIFTGAGNVGKTSIVLNLLKRGYEYLSDDWLVIGEGKAYPFPKPIHIYDYNLKNKEIAKSVLGMKRFLFKPFFRLLEIARTYAPHRYPRYALEVVKPTFYVDPKVLVAGCKISSSATISKIIYLQRGNVNKIVVTDDVTPEELARRMAYVNLYERNYFFKEYYRYVYLYGISSKKIENRFEHEMNLMYSNFKKVKILRATIPESLDLTAIDVISALKLG